VNAYADDELVPIPNPYRGLTARKGNREVNVHEVADGTVYYGLYDFDRDDCPYYCVGCYRCSVDEFIDRLGGHMARGDAAVFSLLDDREPFELRPTSTSTKR
jgi:hypothetical protein